MRAGALNKRALFSRRVPASDGAGGSTGTWMPLLAVWAQFVPERGRERIRAGRLDAAAAGILRTRSSVATRDITTQDRVSIDGTTYDIRAIANPDQRGIMIEMTLESIV